jgi:hypothetical protein
VNTGPCEDPAGKKQKKKKPKNNVTIKMKRGAGEAEEAEREEEREREREKFIDNQIDDCGGRLFRMTPPLGTRGPAYGGEYYTTTRRGRRT